MRYFLLNKTWDTKPYGGDSTYHKTMQIHRKKVMQQNENESIYNNCSSEIWSSLTIVFLWERKKEEDFSTTH